MAVKTSWVFPLFAPPQLLPQPHRPSTEIRFSRWNNANAQKYILRGKTQKELEDQLRSEKRFDSALSIAHNYNPAPPQPITFKSTGTPSKPSSPSIPGKVSKYSKNPNHRTTHPAFKPLLPKTRKIPINETETQNQNPVGPNFRIDENGVSYEIPDAPFVYQYSYTETPKVMPVKLREPLVSPFGPGTISKPWLGRKPLPPSKKKLPEFDSFQLPPPHKKGVKPVQAPGPFLPGSGPKYVRSREEILGAPLTSQEVEELIEGAKKSMRQLHMGRDGLIHNMLDNIHAHWKRKRVCKIKCRGVCTVDMDSVCQQLEEKTGGKIIYCRGGILYLFRGRNYNYKSRPRLPLMLWKPITPMYPRLIQRVPDGLTFEEAFDMRKKGRDLLPLCKLAKNGVYCDLVKNIREAFEACELVRINCQGLNPTDYRKIGAKLKDLVPCVLLSFEFDHILVWRGRDWKSSFEPDESLRGLPEVKADGIGLGLSPASAPSVPNLCVTEPKYDDPKTTLIPTCSYEKSQGTSEFGAEDVASGVPATSGVASYELTPEKSNDQSMGSPVFPVSCDNNSEAFNQTVESEIVLDGSVKSQTTLETTEATATVLDFSLGVSQPHEQLNNTKSSDEQTSFYMPCMEGIMLLREQAVQNGMALVLEDRILDADSVFKRAATFAKTARTGPFFRRRPKKLVVERKKEEECDEDSGVKEEASVVMGTEITVSSKRDERKTYKSKKKEDIRADYIHVARRGNLGVDKLARLLA